MNRVGIYNLKDRVISDLSGGEFHRMLIARALAVEPKLLLLDEPTASVDANSSEQIFSLLNELNQSMTSIMVTHDFLAVSSNAKSLAFFNGKLIYHGGTTLNEELLKALYGGPINLLAHGLPYRKRAEEDK